MIQCKAGEVCGGTRHVKDDETGRWSRCSCYFRSAQLRRLRTAGIPERYADYPAETAVHDSDYHMPLAGVPNHGEHLRNVASWLIKGPAQVLTVPAHGPCDTFPIGGYLAARVALAMDVAQMNGLWLVRREFSDSDAVAIGTKAPFLLLWGFGGDTNHAWLGPLIYRVLYDRTQHRRPTVVTYAPNGEASAGVGLYGNALVEFLAHQKRLTG